MHVPSTGAPTYPLPHRRISDVSSTWNEVGKVALETLALFSGIVLHSALTSNDLLLEDGGTDIANFISALYITSTINYLLPKKLSTHRLFSICFIAYVILFAGFLPAPAEEPLSSALFWTSCLKFTAQGAMRAFDWKTHPRVAQIARWAGANPNQVVDGRFTLLSEAVKSENHRKVETLLHAGADVRLVDTLGRNPLHYAYNAQIADLLLRAGADPNFKDNDDQSPLHIIVGWCHNEAALRRLLDARIDVNLASSHNTTALHVAAWNRKTQFVRLLLDAGAWVNATDNDGTTPLIIAARTMNLESVELLLERGANPNAKNVAYQTPLTAAINDSTIVARLLSAGANILDTDNLDKTGRALKRIKVNTARLLVDWAKGSDQVVSTLLAPFYNDLNLRLSAQAGFNCDVQRILSRFLAVEHLRQLFEHVPMSDVKRASIRSYFA